MEDNDYLLPFSKYLENMHDKYAIAITKCQYAIMTGGLTHEGMSAQLTKQIRPDIKTNDWGVALNPNELYENGNIMILGYPYFMQVELPQRELLSRDQFEKLKSILLEVKNFNDANREKGFGKTFELFIIGGDLVKVEADYYQDRIDELINLLSTFVQDEVIVPNEVIIGEKLGKNKII